MGPDRNVITRHMDMKRTKGIAAIGAMIALLGLSDAVAGDETFPCLIAASSEVEIGSPVVGVLAAVEVERSDEVRKGEVIARLRATVERRSVDLAALRAGDDSEIEAASAAADHARREKERAVALYEKQLVSRQFLDKAITEFTLAQQKLQQAHANEAQAREELRLARAQLRQRTIRSPIDGIVAERYMSPGQRVQDSPIVKIVAVDPLKVDVVVPATYFNRLRKGDRMRIQPELAGLKETSAEITILDRFIDAASNTFRVTLELPNPRHSIPPGARCTARLDAEPARQPQQSDPAEDEFEPQASSAATPKKAVAADSGSRTIVDTQLIIDDKEYDPASNPFIQ